jgi:hypothetical protein
VPAMGDPLDLELTLGANLRATHAVDRRADARRPDTRTARQM